jgi:hypothetical protein
MHNFSSYLYLLTSVFFKFSRSVQYKRHKNTTTVRNLRPRGYFYKTVIDYLSIAQKVRLIPYQLDRSIAFVGFFFSRILFSA